MNRYAAALGRQAFARARAALAPGVPALGPDWLDAQAVHALWLDSSTELPTLHLALTGAAPAHAFPDRWHLGNEACIRLRAEMLPIARAHANVPDVLSIRSAQIHGTAAALVRHELGADGYLLTCGHVVAPDASAQAGDPVRVCSASALSSGQLSQWQPDWRADAAPSTLDAALIRVDAELFSTLRREADLLPNGLATWSAGTTVSLRCQGASKSGPVLGPWAGTVRLDDGGSYYLDKGVGYSAGSVPGDSGAAVWNGAEQLIGMNIAGIVNAPADQPNSVFIPIQPILEQLRILPELRSGVSAGAPAKLSIASSMPALQGNDRDVTARTLWGEARNQGERGMRAVACVINNRWKTQYRRRKTPTDVCLDRWQFSCWNTSDPNLAKLRAVTPTSSAAFAMALQLADELIAGSLVDITFRARHYYAATAKPPLWAQGHQPCAVIGDHLFFNDVL